MEETKRIEEIIKRLDKLYPGARYYLNFSNPLEQLVAVILSAQVRDSVTNAATPALFAKYKTAKDYANANLGELESMISKITYFRAKAGYIQKACKVLVEKFGGQVPQTMDELLTLPGIGRKSANAILINAFNKVEGVVVDTHVIRLSRRLGFTQNKDPEKIEKDLTRVIPKSHWKKITWWMKDHGRALCRAPLPICPDCKLADICPKIGV